MKLNGVEEIIVTASKRESKIEDLPMSVQAIAGSRLESANVNDFMDYAELILLFLISSMGLEDPPFILEALQTETLGI